MTRVIIVDNQETFRKGLKQILLNFGDVEVVAEAASGSEFLNLLTNTDADIAFLDVMMPGLNGIEITRKVKNEKPELTIIGFSNYENAECIEKMLEAGASGYLSKSRYNFDILLKIIKEPKLGIFISEGLPEIMLKTGIVNNNINPQKKES